MYWFALYWILGASITFFYFYRKSPPDDAYGWNALFFAAGIYGLIALPIYLFIFIISGLIGGFIIIDEEIDDFKKGQ